MPNLTATQLHQARRHTDEEYRRTTRIPVSEDAGFGFGRRNHCPIAGGCLFGETGECDLVSGTSSRSLGRTVRREAGTPAYRQLVDIWERWARRSAPPAFLCHFNEFVLPEPNTDNPAILFLWQSSRKPYLAARRVARFQHGSTQKAFWGDFPSQMKLTNAHYFQVWIGGQRYSFSGYDRLKRIAELYLLHATCGVRL